MAQRRMFSLQIVDSDAFLDMGQGSQLLYFHLGLRADDDGFVDNPKKVARMVGASDDDMKVLLAKRFLLSFESGVVVIKHWKIHNYIQNDRYHETKYVEEKSKIEVKANQSYTEKKPKKYIEDRKDEYEESDLPFSFAYKIRSAFVGKPCPLCNFEMRDTGVSITRKPTIQHCIPISKGGKHELGNIAVICHSCNVSLRDTTTEKLNSVEVSEVWSNLVSRMDTEVRLGKVRLGKESEDKELGDKPPKTVKQRVFNPLGAEVIKEFEAIDPKNKTYYPNKGQRGACDFLIETYSLERVLTIIKNVLPKTNGQPYFPNITSPYDLKEKWVKLENAVERYGKEKNINHREIFV